MSERSSSKSASVLYTGGKTEGSSSFSRSRKVVSASVRVLRQRQSVIGTPARCRLIDHLVGSFRIRVTGLVAQHEYEHRSYGNSSGHYRLSVSFPDAALIETDNNWQVDKCRTCIEKFS